MKKISHSYIVILVVIVFSFFIVHPSVYSRFLDSNHIHTVIEGVFPNVVIIFDKNQPIGAGTIIDPKRGIVLTSKHLLSSTGLYTARTQNGQIYVLNKITYDTLHDLAVALILPDSSLQKLQPLSLIGPKEGLRRGDTVISFGIITINQSVILSQGIISDTRQKVTLDEGEGKSDYFIQTDINTQNGFSGGPLVDMRGHIIGVNTAVFGINNNISWSTPVTKESIANLVDRM